MQACIDDGARVCHKKISHHNPSSQARQRAWGRRPKSCCACWLASPCLKMTWAFCCSVPCCCMAASSTRPQRRWRYASSLSGKLSKCPWREYQRNYNDCLCSFATSKYRKIGLLQEVLDLAVSKLFPREFSSSHSFSQCSLGEDIALCAVKRQSRTLLTNAVSILLTRHLLEV